MAAVLFLAPTDLGEAVLATGALAHALELGGRLIVVATPEARALFRAAPGLVATHEAPAGAGALHLWRLRRRLARARIDVVIDGRGGLLGKLIAAPRRVALKPGALRHRCEEWGEAMGAPRALAPRLWLDAQARAAADAALAHAGPLLALAPGGAEAAKRWRPDRFAAVARRLVTAPLADAKVAVLGAGERDRDIADAIVASLDADGIAARDLSGLDLLAAAAALERATLVVGNDNALAHIAAAVGAPTLALFGPTDERVRAPFGPRARTLRGAPLEQACAKAGLDASAAMDDVSIDAVESACIDLLHAGGLH